MLRHTHFPPLRKSLPSFHMVSERADSKSGLHSCKDQMLSANAPSQSRIRIFVSRSLCEAVEGGQSRSAGWRWRKGKERKSLGVVYGLDASQTRRRVMDESRRPWCSKAKWRQREINEEQIYEWKKYTNEFTAWRGLWWRTEWCNSFWILLNGF